MQIRQDPFYEEDFVEEAELEIGGCVAADGFDDFGYGWENVV